MELNSTNSPLLAVTINITEDELEALADAVENAYLVAKDEGYTTEGEDAILRRFVELLREAN